MLHYQKWKKMVLFILLRKIDIYFSLFIQPPVLYRQLHTVKQKSIKQFRFTGKALKLRICKKDFRHTVKRIGFRFFTVMIRKFICIILCSDAPSLLSQPSQCSNPDREYVFHKDSLHMAPSELPSCEVVEKKYDKNILSFCISFSRH